jgi:hypothetical protein
VAVPRRTLTLLRKLANQVGKTTDDTVRELARSWVQAWDELSPAWQDAIAALVDQHQRTGVWPVPWQAARIEAVAVAQQRTEQALASLTANAATATRAAAAEASKGTLAAEPAIIGSQRPGLDAAGASRSSADRELTRRQARITELHRPIPDRTAQAIRQVFRGLPHAASSTPLTQHLYARVRAGFDSGLTRAATITRTETVDTYRTAAALVHTANARVLVGWAWTCTCDRKSCPACWVMHGRQFPLDTPGPEGHGGCRCTRLPLAAGVSLPTAEARFRRLTRRDQIAILGPGRFELWRLGRVAWDDLAARRSNQGWRDSIVPRPVADLNRMAGIR